MCLEEMLLKRKHLLYFKLMISMKKDDENEVWNELKISKLQLQIIKLKRLIIKSFGKNFNPCLFPLMLHLLDNAVKDLFVFQTPLVLNDSPFVVYIVTIKQAYMQTSERSNTFVKKNLAKVGNQLQMSKLLNTTCMSETEKKAKSCIKEYVLQDETSSVCDEEKIGRSRTFLLLIRCASSV